MLNSYNFSIESAWVGRQAYAPMLEKLRERAASVACGDADEIIWTCEHEAVYTTGRRAIDNRLESSLPAPWIETDRGGETTFHGVGQIMLYPILNLRQRGLSVRQYIHLLEQSAMDVLLQYHVQSARRCGLPGIWTPDGKVAAIGIRISQGVAYHGMAMNIAVDMSYFRAINPCGTNQKAVNLEDYIQNLPSLMVLANQWNQSLQSLLKGKPVA